MVPGKGMEDLRVPLHRQDTDRRQPPLGGADPATASSLYTEARSLVETAATVHQPILDDIGLASTIEWMTQTMLPFPEVTAHTDLYRQGLNQLPRTAAIVVLLVVQEALTNTLRHSSASRVELVAERDGDRLNLRVTDDGHGFAVARYDVSQSWGLREMQVRADLIGAELVIASEPRHGTRILLSIPTPQ